QSVLAGLAALLATAALENPRFVGQCILIPRETTAAELAEQLKGEPRTLDPLIRYENGRRQVSRWEEIAADRNEPPIAFRDDGVYLISGGLGALGLVFAKEILERTRRAKVVLTGRAALSAEKQARLNELSGRAS